MKERRLPVIARNEEELRALLIKMNESFVSKQVDVDKVLSNIIMSNNSKCGICIFINEIDETFSWLESVWLNNNDDNRSITINTYLNKEEL